MDDGVRVAAIDGCDQVALADDDFYLRNGRVLHLPGGGIGGQEPRQAAMRDRFEDSSGGFAVLLTGQT
ncbi:hypothetical protein ACFRQM_16915 [Streptomyces sp. NPDC056831]|uniref:hypothetical protein n=1 Tax=Streptomyces sp. NPDC056831 TaxID=3345954 RepID=UPI0036BE9F4D